MKPPMPNPPQNGQRLPPKPSRAEVEDLARDARDRATRAERREITLARLVVFVLTAPWYLRAWYCLRILVRLPLAVSRKALESVNAQQLFARTSKKGFVLGADRKAKS